MANLVSAFFVLFECKLNVSEIEPVGWIDSSLINELMNFLTFHGPIIHCNVLNVSLGLNAKYM